MAAVRSDPKLTLRRLDENVRHDHLVTGSVRPFPYRLVPLVPVGSELRDPYVARDRVDRRTYVGRQALVFRLVHHDEECRGVELRLDMEFHEIVEALQRIAPVRHDAVDFAVLHGGHHVVHL